jgi:hypothetical protein
MGYLRLGAFATITHIATMTTELYSTPKHQTGRGRGIRTPDTLLPKQVRYQAALYPEMSKAVRTILNHFTVSQRYSR